MTNLELTKLCADAMGLHRATWSDPNIFHVEEVVSSNERCENTYDPLTDDAQVMALVKKFELETRYNKMASTWVATPSYEPEPWCPDENLNRAICECVAKMQLSRNTNREVK